MRKNYNKREFFLFFAGIYGERLYIWLDVILSQMPMLKDVLFLTGLYLAIIVFTSNDT